MELSKPVAFVLILFVAAGYDQELHLLKAEAQDAKSEQIFLDEPEQEPPPTVVRTDKHTEKYDNDSPRIEREIALLSNEQIVSHGKYAEYYRDGEKYSQGSYKLGLHVGQWRYWHPNGQICKTVEFKAGKPHGQWKVFRSDGTLEATKSYDNGLRQGAWNLFFEDGKQPKVELVYEQGKIVGDRKIFFPNGQVRQQIPYQDGLMHGTAINWNEEGEKVSEMLFEKGALNGKPKLFNSPVGASKPSS